MQKKQSIRYVLNEDRYIISKFIDNIYMQHIVGSKRVNHA
jgi:hypothetical protein